MKKFTILFAVFYMCHAFCATTAASAGDTMSAIGRGIGVNEQSAIDDALCDAVKYAIGFYIEAETIVKNDKLVKDEILTHSNAYVTHYEVTNCKAFDGGLVDVTILATVKKQPLVLKLRDVMPTVTLNVSEASHDLYAQIVTQDKRDADAEKLLKNALDNFDPLTQLMKVTVLNDKAPEVSPSKEAPNEAKILSYQLKFAFDSDRYRKWVSRMDKILSQISLSPGKSFNFKRVKSLGGLWKDKFGPRHFSEMMRDAYFAYDKMYFMAATLLDEERFIYGQSCGIEGYQNPGAEMATAIFLGRKEDCPFYNLYNVGGRMRSIRRWGAWPEMKAKGKLYVALVKRANSSGCTGTLYEMSDRSAAVISDWMAHYTGATEVRQYRDTSARGTNYHVSLKDAMGEELGSGDCRAFNFDMSNIGCVCWGDDESSDNRNKPGNTIPYVAYITPWLGCFAGEATTWVDIEMNTSDIGKFTTITVSPEK